MLQPFIIALMTNLLALKPNPNVLEIAIGSSYQTAVLSLLADKIYSIEVISELAFAAKQGAINI